MKAKCNRVAMIGAFPPPVNGMSTVNAAVYEHLKQVGVTPMMINLAANSLDRSFAVRLRRIPKIFTGLIRLLLDPMNRIKTLYMSVSGGLGQGYEILFLLVGRIRGMRLYLHHHSYSYLIRRSRVTELLTKVAGPSATHLSLCPSMARLLNRNYPTMHQIWPISNATILFANLPNRHQYRSQLQTVGFFGNISADKGVFDFLNLIQALVEEKIAVEAKIAGPFQDAETEREVRRLLSQQNQVEYVGPKYGLEKDVFLSTIDLLIFPTRYVNEAEPLTIHEAMRCGLPVITIGRGCIFEIVNSESGKVIDPSEPFVPAALEQIKEWIAFPKTFATASRSATKRFILNVSDSLQIWTKLLVEIAGDR